MVNLKSDLIKNSVNGIHKINKKNLNIVKIKQQVDILLKYIYKWFLTQKVGEATRLDNLLYLTFENVNKLKIIKMLQNVNVWGHRTLIVEMKFNIVEENSDEKVNFSHLYLI